MEESTARSELRNRALIIVDPSVCRAIPNSLLHLGYLMHPTHPYAAFFIPWVLPSHSETTTPAIASMMPNWAIHKWYEVSDFLSRQDIKPDLGPSTARPGVKMETDEMTKAIDEYIPLLQQDEQGGGYDAKIEMDVFFAETDNSSGERGSQWFDEMWKREGDGWIKYISSMVPGTTHEAIMRAGSGALESGPDPGECLGGKIAPSGPPSSRADS
jgi:hypothetical protein